MTKIINDIHVDQIAKNTYKASFSFLRDLNLQNKKLVNVNKFDVKNLKHNEVQYYNNQIIFKAV